MTDPEICEAQRRARNAAIIRYDISHSARKALADDVNSLADEVKRLREALQRIDFVCVDRTRSPLAILEAVSFEAREALR